MSDTAYCAKHQRCEEITDVAKHEDVSRQGQSNYAVFGGRLVKVTLSCGQTLGVVMAL
jgi:hypothetical protein